MRAWTLCLMTLAALAAFSLGGCKDKAPPPEPAQEKPAAAEPRTVQIEEQQVKVMTDPNQVKQEVEGTLEAGMKARDAKMGE
jgi:hypothetical protein